jgi:hypothetical protein
MFIRFTMESINFTMRCSLIDNALNNFLFFSYFFTIATFAFVFFSNLFSSSTTVSTGCDFILKHVDGSMLRVESKPGMVIKPDSLMTLEGKGLPFHKTPYQFGNLFVLFTVKFPESLTDD